MDWVGRHLDYDGEETWLVEAHGPPDDPTPPCKPVCKHCYAVQLPPDAEDTLEAIHPLSLYPNDLVNHPRLEEVLRRAREIVSTREPLPLKVITSLKFSDEETVETLARYVDQIDVHVMSTDPKVRASLTNEDIRAAEKALEAVSWVPDVADPVANLVVVPGYNNDHVMSTLKDLDDMEFRKCVVIPVGVTDYNPFGIEPPTERELETLRAIVRRANKELDMNVVPCDSLRDPMEVANREKLDDVASELALVVEKHDVEVGLVTGEAFGPVIEALAKAVNASCERGRVEAIIVENRYFGGNISCAGLLTGRDVLNELRGKKLDVLVLPEISVETGTFIDGISPLELTVVCDCEVTTASCLSEVPTRVEEALEGPQRITEGVL